MAISSASHHCTALQTLTVFSMLAVLVADVGGQLDGACLPFSCGDASNISYPFRQQGDSDQCGLFELICTATKATIQIGGGTYYVVSINYTGSYFWVVDTNLGMQSSCPLPRWDYRGSSKPRPDYRSVWATFVNCSEEISDARYRPVRCLSTIDSFIYVFTGNKHNPASARNVNPSCGYLAMTPLGGAGITVPEDASYEDVVKFMRKGFALALPLPVPLIDEYRVRQLMMASTVLFRFMCVLVLFIFVAHKYWKERITVDTVEKFLRMQQLLGGPLRYAYTDVIAITGHFRDRLGQGGYGSVYKGVLSPGNIHFAIKMLSNSKCNGEEFISEVSTIGRIHHVNVVRLVGFCSEEKRRALIYEYMPNGSLDRYIFSSEKSFSWDMLNKIALGIARGINYLHHGCDMQILHFDIKPHNILLDHNFVPKVADFGLAKLFPRDNDSFVPLSAMRGTIGYIAPEMVSRSFGAVSSKSDVYSFGMLLLEMAGGRRNADPNVANSSQNYYPSWVYDKLIEEQVGDRSVINMHELEKKLCIVGLWCIQMKSHDRPSMSDVIEMLESDVNVLEMPSRPFFCDGHEQVPAVDSYYLSSELDDIVEDE